MMFVFFSTILSLICFEQLMILIIVKLNRQIDSISSLKTKESILKLCQLMFRTENIQSRLVILNLLLVRFYFIFIIIQIAG